jgi:endonuclease YncB( thermonuclease family)
MNNPRSRLSLLFVLLLLLSVSSSHAAASILEGTVVKITDGDSITVLDSNREQHKVRIAGIDAPEKGQPFGNASRISDVRYSTMCYKGIHRRWRAASP